MGHVRQSGPQYPDGPGLATVNLSVVKNFAFRERATAQFRAEGFKSANRTNSELPDNFVGSPTFGQITSAGSPRRVQLGLKILF